MLITAKQEQELRALIKKPANERELLEYLWANANKGQGWYELADNLENHVITKIIGLFKQELKERKEKGHTGRNDTSTVRIRK